MNLVKINLWAIHATQYNPGQFFLQLEANFRLEGSQIVTSPNCRAADVLSLWTTMRSLSVQHWFLLQWWIVYLVISSGLETRRSKLFSWKLSEWLNKTEVFLAIELCDMAIIFLLFWHTRYNESPLTLTVQQFRHKRQFKLSVIWLYMKSIGRRWNFKFDSNSTVPQNKKDCLGKNRGSLSAVWHIKS